MKAHEEFVYEFGAVAEVRTCEITSLLCNSIVKVAHVKVIQPYTFWMDQAQWEEVYAKNKLEYHLAILFAFQNDLNEYKHTPYNSSKIAFHTQMYVNFNRFLKDMAYKKAGKVAAEFQSKSLLFIPKLSWPSAVGTLSFAKKTLMSRRL